MELMFLGQYRAFLEENRPLISAKPQTKGNVPLTLPQCNNASVDVLQFGNYLVKQEGSDNLDVFYATYLERQLPEVLNKLKLLLRETYNFIQVEPITFRITSAGPRDGYGVNPDSMALNETVRFQLFVDV
jgi:hypothetical protein